MSGEVVLLLNNDVEPVEPGWLDRIVASAIEPDVGAVGPRLLDSDRTIEHASVMLCLGGAPVTYGKARPQIGRVAILQSSTENKIGRDRCMSRCAPRSLRKGCRLDERFGVAFNDIDFCLRLGTDGFRTVYREDAVLVHHESWSRGVDDLSGSSRVRLAAEMRLFFERGRDRIREDPLSLPAFDLTSETGVVHRALTQSRRRIRQRFMLR